MHPGTHILKDDGSHKVEILKAINQANMKCSYLQALSTGVIKEVIGKQPHTSLQRRLQTLLKLTEREKIWAINVVKMNFSCTVSFSEAD